MTKLMGLLGILTVLVPSVAGAEVVTLSPTAAVAVDEEGVTKVVVRFDLSGVPEGASIHEATLDWTVPGVEGEGYTEFSALAATASWTAGSVESAGMPAARATPAAEWSIAAKDYDRSGGLVRFYVRELVREWHSGSLTNYGLVLEMADLGAESLGQALNGAVLTVRYGFN